ncbi:MAG: amidohydrolase family protein [Candidatus Thorarchaeota archaeon]|nr:MAG: amidohydrolase family protein [Candidatus Thorarchaeota archaeon]
MTTDIHTHLGADRNSFDLVNYDNYQMLTEELVSRMDAFGIEKAVLSPLEPSKGNELYIDATAIYPDRLFSACTLMPRPIDAARGKLKEYIDKGCVALVLDDRLYHPQDPAPLILVSEAVEKNIPVYLHTDVMTTEVMSFIDRASTMYPSGKFVIMHMGGIFGFPQLIPLVKRTNIFLETSVTLARIVESPLRVFLDALLQDIGVPKLVFGSEHHSEYLYLTGALNDINLNEETIRIKTKKKNCLHNGLSFS